jgi:hypothetical protein
MMPSNVATFRCLLVSPTDVSMERDAIVHVIDSWNAHVGAGLQARVECVRWDSHARPEMSGPAQQSLNKQLVDTCDFGIAVFWSRLGSPTENYSSGSAEEVERLIARGADVMVYFSRMAIPQERLQDDQFLRLQELRKDYRQRGLLAEYDSVESLKEMVLLHITSLLSSVLTTARVGNQPIPSAGLLSAPKPDVRVIVAGAVVAGPTHQASLISIEVQNHSPVAFFFGAITFSLSSAFVLHPTEDEVHGRIHARTLEPGNGFSLYFDPEKLKRSAKGAQIIGVSIRDKIGRSYPGDPSEVTSALASAEQFAETLRTSRSGARV